MQGVHWDASALPEIAGRVYVPVQAGEVRLLSLDGAIQFRYEANRSQRLFRCVSLSNKHMALLRFQTDRFQIRIDKLGQRNEIRHRSGGDSRLRCDGRTGCGEASRSLGIQEAKRNENACNLLYTHNLHFPCLRR